MAPNEDKSFFFDMICFNVPKKSKHFCGFAIEFGQIQASKTAV